jgi:arsenate reductase
MSSQSIIGAFSALGHEQRLAIYRLLIEAGSDGMNAGAIAERIGIVPSSLTFHTQSLLRCGLIRQRRVSRNLIYSAEPGPITAILSEFSGLCGLPSVAVAPAATGATALPAVKILLLCTGNNALSIMAEAMINDLGGGQWQAFSAGSDPASQIHPLTLEVLRENGHSVEGLRCKSWDDFALRPKMDLVVTLCEDTAGELCPIWPGEPAEMHISFPDPAMSSGNPQQKAAEFRRVYQLIAARVRLLLRCP